MKPKVTIDLEEYENLKNIRSKTINMLQENAVFQFPLRDLFNQNMPGSYIWCSDKANLDRNLSMAIETLKISNEELRQKLYEAEKINIEAKLNKRKNWWL